MKEPIELKLDLDQVNYLEDYLRTDAPDDPYLQDIANLIHEQTYL